MRKKYPSDITREQFEQIAPLLEGLRKKTRPPTVDLYEVSCAVLYLLKSGCQWRMLPEGFPKWRTVHAYFTIWSQPQAHGISVLEHALKKSGWRGPHQTGAQRQQHVLDRGRAEREKTPTRQSTKAMTRARKCRASNVTLPWTRKAALQALGRCKGSLGQVQSLLCDSGYVGQPFEHGVKDILGEHVTVQIAKRSQLHTFKVMPKRWVVERSFAWLDKNRRLWKNCERLVNTSLQFIHLAFLALLPKRF